MPHATASAAPGQGFFPTLADDDWLWGGGLDQIEYTIRHGIRNGQDPDARDTAMPSFGADGLLDQKQIGDVTQYVLSLSGQADDQAAADRGAAIFTENCAACHGEDGGGMQEMGAPSLKDAIWLYGSEPAQIAAQIYRPRLGVMPTWQGRLDDDDDQDAGGLRPQPRRRAISRCAPPTRPPHHPLPASPAAAIEGPSSPASERSAAW